MRQIQPFIHIAVFSQKTCIKLVAPPTLIRKKAFSTSQLLHCCSIINGWHWHVYQYQQEAPAEGIYLFIQIRDGNRGQTLHLVSPITSGTTSLPLGRHPLGLGWGGHWVFQDRHSRCTSEAERMGKLGIVLNRIIWVYNLKKWCSVLNFWWGSEDIKVKSSSPHRQLLNLPLLWPFIELNTTICLCLTSDCQLATFRNKAAWILDS